MAEPLYLARLNRVRRNVGPPRDALDQAIRDLRVEGIPRRPSTAPLPAWTRAEQLEHFLALANEVGINRHDIAHLRARGHNVNDEGKVSA